MRYEQRDTRYESGFTVIELIMVILVISILAVVIITKTGSYYPIKLNGAGEKMLSDIRYAKRLAMTNHRTYGILFNAAGNSYTVYDGTSVTPVEDPHRPGNPLEIDYDENTYYNGIEITSAGFGGTNELKFDSFGVPYDGNDSELDANGTVMLNCRGNNFTVTVIPRTGKLSH